MVFGVLATMGRADLKATVRVSVTGGPQATSGDGRDRRVTIVQSGAKVRIQREGESKWLLLDGDRKILVDDEAKTYAEMTGRQAPPSDRGSASSTVKMTKTGSTKSIQGLETIRYDLGGSVSVQPQGNGGRRGGLRGGRRGGLGSGPGGGLSFGVKGALWVAPDVSGIAFGDVIGERGRMLGPVGEQLKDAGLVLEGTVEIVPPPMLQSRMGKTSISFVTESIDRAHQDGRQFEWPSAYKKVDPPAPRSRGMGG